MIVGDRVIAKANLICRLTRNETFLIRLFFEGKIRVMATTPGVYFERPFISPLKKYFYCSRHDPISNPSSCMRFIPRKTICCGRFSRNTIWQVRRVWFYVPRQPSQQLRLKFELMIPHFEEHLIIESVEPSGISLKVPLQVLLTNTDNDKVPRNIVVNKPARASKNSLSLSERYRAMLNWVSGISPQTAWSRYRYECV